MNGKKMGERCLQERHDDVIDRQKRAIADLRNSLKESGYPTKPQSKSSIIYITYTMENILPLVFWVCYTPL